MMQSPILITFQCDLFGKCGKGNKGVFFQEKVVAGGSESFSLFRLTGVALKDEEAEGQLRTTERASGAE